MPFITEPRWRRALFATAMLTCAPFPAQAGPDAAIRDGEVLGVHAGMSLDEAEKAAPSLSWRYEPAFMVDFSAACAIQGSEELFCALVYENSDRNGDDPIEAIAVFGPSLATEEGVHAGMTLADAAAIYGEPTLAYHLENEGREFMSFAGAPDWLNFRASSKSTPNGYAGIYPPRPEGEVAQETGDYAPDAVLDSLWLY